MIYGLTRISPVALRFSANGLILEGWCVMSATPGAWTRFSGASLFACALPAPGIEVIPPSVFSVDAAGQSEELAG